MNYRFIIFIVGTVGLFYFGSKVLGDLDPQGKKVSFSDKKNFLALDTVGREIIDVRGKSKSMQMNAWNQSPLKEDFLDLFPNFIEMKYFIEERVRGDILSQKLTLLLERVESRYVSGKIDRTDAKQALGTLK